MPNAYLDQFDFTRAPHGLEYLSLLGNSARFTSAQTAGATSLTVPTSGAQSITVQLNQFDRVTILDGSNTEVVQVGAAGAAVGASSIPLLAGTSLQFTHAIGVAWCSDGTSGSLADQIVNASAWIENTICNQPLLQTTWTNEQLFLPSMRASINNEGILHFRPRHWPVSSLTALSIATTAVSSTAYDPSQAFIDSDKQVCAIPNLVPLPSQGQPVPAPYPITPQLSRSASAQLTITYQSGFAYSALPGEVKEVAILAVSDLLAKRQNPLGADQQRQGDVQIISTLRGDLSGESLLIKRAKGMLAHYIVSPF
jgi:hypothetical protein